MKTLTTLLIISITSFFTICKAQSDQEKSNGDTLKPMNMLDAQTQMYGQIFDLAGAGEHNPLGGASNYLELIEQMDMSEEQKEKLREQYKQYDRSLDSKKKDSLKSDFDDSLMEAAEKSKSQNK